MWLQIINTLGLLGIAWLGYLSRKDIKDVHVLINSRLTQLLELTQKSSHAEGVLEGKDEKPRQKSGS